MDAIKDKVLEQFSTELTVTSLILALVTAFAIALFIILVYRKTFSGIVYNRSMSLTFCMLSMITALIIMTINTNLALSLGMVGALSIVRFRTAVKEPLDIAFMFWAIAAGIMCGAGLYVYAIVGSLALGLLFYLLFVLGVRPKSKYLLVLDLTPEAVPGVDEALKSLARKNLKSQTSTATGWERTYEVQLAKGEKENDLLTALKGISGVENVNLVSYQNDFGF